MGQEIKSTLDLREAPPTVGGALPESLGFRTKMFIIRFRGSLKMGKKGIRLVRSRQTNCGRYTLNGRGVLKVGGASRKIQ